jgi:hypothetical protein
LALRRILKKPPDWGALVFCVGVATPHTSLRAKPKQSRKKRHCELRSSEAIQELQ